MPPLAKTAHTTKEMVKKLKSNDNHLAGYVDLNTVIVEYIRPDGHRLKIHTTNQSLGEVMRAFSQTGVAV